MKLDLNFRGMKKGNNSRFNGSIMRTTKWQSVVFIGILLSSVFSCKKPVEEWGELPESLENGLLTLNEGLFQQNNATLTWYDLQSHQAFHHVFESKTGVGLGDTGNDLAIYGDKIYVVINNSHILHVLHRRTGKLIKHVSLTNNNSGSSPRQIAFHESYAYISAFDGSVFKLDTTSINIQQIGQAGINPDGIIVYQDRLFVSNSGGLTSEGDSTISVFQLPQLTEISRITVGRNPGKMVFDNAGNLFVVARGNYTTIPPKLVKVDLNSLEIMSSNTMDVGGVVFANGKLFVSHYNSSQGTSKLMTVNPNTMMVEQENSIGHLGIQTLFGMQHLQILGQDVLVLSDAKQYIHQGKVIVIDLSGNLLFDYTSGLNPNKTIFISPQ